MIELIVVSLIWAFSFGLIKDNLTGIDPNFVAFVRLGLAFLIFAPLLRLRGFSRRTALALVLTGAVQYGIMYIAYIFSFRFLKSYEVALFTILTPFYLTIINDFFQRRFQWFNLFTALLAITATAVIQSGGTLGSDLLTGFLIVQVSNLAFAFGQLYYKRILASTPDVKDHQVFGLLYGGAVLLTFASTTLSTGWQGISLTGSQVLSLLYLGIIASGLGFFLWNRGARKVDNGLLAVFNNLKIPLSVAVSLLVFGERTNIPNLLVGGVIMLVALVLSELKPVRLIKILKSSGLPI